MNLGIIWDKLDEEDRAIIAYAVKCYLNREDISKLIPYNKLIFLNPSFTIDALRYYNKFMVLKLEHKERIWCIIRKINGLDFK